MAAFFPESQSPSNSSPNSLQKRRLPRWLTWLLVALVMLGVGWRFTNLPGRYYWNDEAVTGLRTSGYFIDDFKRQFDNRVIAFGDLQVFQRAKPGSNLANTVQSLAIEDAKHPPLYSILVWAWKRIFGESLLGVRAFSALISVLILPAVYWFGVELFGSSLVGWLSMTLVALSPVHLLYAQEARAYSLWTLAIVVSSAALLWAMRRWQLGEKAIGPWLLYIFAGAVGVYSQTLFGFTLLAHLLYVGLQGWQVRRRGLKFVSHLWGSFALALVTIGGLFVPWLVQILNTQTMLKATTGWVLSPMPKLKIVKHWLVGWSAMFLDWDGLVAAAIRNGTDQWTMYGPRIIIVIGVLAALVYLCRRAQPAAAWFLMLFIGTTVGGLMVPDLVTGGQRSISARYFLGVYVAMQMAVAYWFAMKLESRSRLRQQIALGMLGLLFGLQILSCNTILQSSVWWNKNVNIFAAMQVINRSAKPYVIAEPEGMNPGTLVAMSYGVKSEVPLQLTDLKAIPAIPNGFSDVFIFSTNGKRSRSIHDLYEKQYGVRLQSVAEGMLWRVDR